jgi:hypothetical protein
MMLLPLHVVYELSGMSDVHSDTNEYVDVHYNHSISFLVHARDSRAY